METCSALLALCEENTSVHNALVMLSVQMFFIIFVAILNQLFYKLPKGTHDAHVTSM